MSPYNLQTDRQTFRRESAGHGYRRIFKDRNEIAGLHPFDIGSHSDAFDLGDKFLSQVKWRDLSGREDEEFIFFLKNAHPIPKAGVKRFRTAQIGRGEFQAALDLPDNGFLDLVAVGADKAGIACRITPGAQSIESFIGAGPIRLGFFNDATEAFESPAVRVDSVANAAVERDAAEILEECDSRAFEASFEIGGEFRARLGEGDRGTRIGAGHDAEEQRDIGNIAS